MPVVGSQTDSRPQGQAKFTSSIHHSLDFWETCQLGCLPRGTFLVWMNPGLSANLSNNGVLAHLRNCNAQVACRHLGGLAGNSMTRSLALH